jgi:hypothetical protein
MDSIFLQHDGVSTKVSTVHSIDRVWPSFGRDPCSDRSEAIGSPLGTSGSNGSAFVTCSRQDSERSRGSELRQ